MTPARATTAERLDAAVADLASATAELSRAAMARDRLVVERRAEGATLRQIAVEAGVTHAAIDKILRKYGHPS